MTVIYRKIPKIQKISLRELDPGVWVKIEVIDKANEEKLEVN